MNQGKRIPIVHCFNENYVIPASVSLLSMLTNASKEYFYDIYVLSDEVSDGSKVRLMDCVHKFENASLSFVNPLKSEQDEARKLFDMASGKAHFSKEIFYKIMTPIIFSEFERVVVSDVDVVWLGDISDTWQEAGDLEDAYFAGVKSFRSPDREIYGQEFSDEEYAKLDVGAGLVVMNLGKFRDHDVLDKCLKFAAENASRLRFPEQDLLNLVCHPKIKLISYRNMVCSHDFEEFYLGGGPPKSLNYSREAVERSLENPVQVHFAGGFKPWVFPASSMASTWFRFLAQTEFLDDWLALVEKGSLKSQTGRSWRIRLNRNRHMVVRTENRQFQSPSVLVPVLRRRSLRISIEKNT